MKIEAAPWNEGVPRSDEDTRDDLYFEHHLKVQQLTSDLHGLEALHEAEIEILKVEEEYVVHDDALLSQTQSKRPADRFSLVNGLLRLVVAGAGFEPA